jgi:hypothetical protein
MHHFCCRYAVDCVQQVMIVVRSFSSFCCFVVSSFSLYVVAVAYTFDRSSVSFSFAILFVISFSLSSRSHSGR